MSDSESRGAQTISPMSFVSLIGIYAAVFAAMIALLLLITHFVEVGNSAMGVILTFVAGMSTAQIWVMRERALPAGPRQWRLALACGLLATAVMVGIAALGFATDDQLMREIRAEDPKLFVAPCLATAVLNILLIRLGLRFGARQSMKTLPKG